MAAKKPEKTLKDFSTDEIVAELSLRDKVRHKKIGSLCGVQLNVGGMPWINERGPMTILVRREN